MACALHQKVSKPLPTSVRLSVCLLTSLSATVSVRWDRKEDNVVDPEPLNDPAPDPGTQTTPDATSVPIPRS